MVGARKKLRAAWRRSLPPSRHKLSSRRRAQRRRVEGSGERDRIFAVRGGLLPTESPAAMSLTGLLPAAQAVMAGRRQPIGQDGEGLAARLTDSAAHPDPVVVFVVACLRRRPWPMMVSSPQQRTSPREQLPAGSHPGSVLSFGLWQCDKENHGWREGPPLTVLPSFDLRPGLHPPGKVSLERKKNTAAGRPLQTIPFCRLAGI